MTSETRQQGQFLVKSLISHFASGPLHLIELFSRTYGSSLVPKGLNSSYGKSRTLVLILWTDSKKDALGSIYLHLGVVFANSKMNPWTISFPLPGGIWAALFTAFDWHAVPPLDSLYWMRMLLIHHPFKSIRTHLWSSMVRAVLWKVWNERNAPIFQDKERYAGEVFELAIFNAFFGV